MEKSQTLQTHNSLKITTITTIFSRNFKISQEWKKQKASNIPKNILTLKTIVYMNSMKTENLNEWNSKNTLNSSSLTKLTQITFYNLYLGTKKISKKFLLQKSHWNLIKNYQCTQQEPKNGVLFNLENRVKWEQRGKISSLSVPWIY